MNTKFWLFISVAMITLGSAMLGRIIVRWAKRSLTRSDAFAGLLSGIAAIGAGATFPMQVRGDPSASWIRLGCILLFATGVLIQTRTRSRIKQ